MILQLALLAAGLCLLTFGAHYLVHGAISLANRFGLPQLLIGLTVVGFGTSMPELLVSLQAALDGFPAIAVGNVIGSNTANILLILGLSALISPIAAKIPNLGRDLVMMIFAAIVMLGLGYLGIIAFWSGLTMVALIAIYLAYVTRTDRNPAGGEDESLAIRMAGWKEGVFIIGGLAGLFYGAHLLVGAATFIAREMGISEAVIGLTIVAVGTSLPELATSVVAAFHRHAEMALGNVVGSNIFNILGILGLTAIITPVEVDPAMASFDIPFMLAISLGLALMIATAGRIGRIASSGMLTVYGLYVWWLF